MKINEIKCFFRGVCKSVMLPLIFIKYKAMLLSSIGFVNITTITQFGNDGMSIKIQVKPSKKPLLILMKITMRETMR